MRQSQLFICSLISFKADGVFAIWEKRIGLPLQLRRNFIMRFSQMYHLAPKPEVQADPLHRHRV